MDNMESPKEKEKSGNTKSEKRSSYEKIETNRESARGRKER